MASTIQTQQLSYSISDFKFSFSDSLMLFFNYRVTSHWQFSRHLQQMLYATSTRYVRTVINSQNIYGGYNHS